MTIIESGSLQLRLARGETPTVQSEASSFGSFPLSNHGNAKSLDYRGRYGLEHAYKRRRSWRRIAAIALIAISPLGALLAWQTGALRLMLSAKVSASDPGTPPRQQSFLFWERAMAAAPNWLRLPKGTADSRSPVSIGAVTPALPHKQPVRRASSSLDAVAYRIGERIVTRGQLLRPERTPPVELVKSFSLDHPAHAGLESAVGRQAVLVAPR
jgi:hypothetical protein